MRFIQALVFLVLQAPALGVLRGASVRELEDGKGWPDVLRAVINTYPETSVPDIVPSGSVTLRFDPDGSFWTKLNVNGLSADCTNCGVHVHAGISCDDTNAPGGHYWNERKLGSGAANDPWNSVSYNSTERGATTSGFYINSGFDFGENDGHAVVIHTEGGARVGCGVLKRFEDTLSLKTNGIGRYPGYTGKLYPSGTVQVKFFGDRSFKYSYKIWGLPQNCVKCGVHIHKGITCEDADLVGPHYWDPSEQYNDPWTPVSGASYNTDEEGTAAGFFYLSSGFNYKENIGHAVVFHQQDGVRVACGLLEEVVEIYG